MNACLFNALLIFTEKMKGKKKYFLRSPDYNVTNWITYNGVPFIIAGERVYDYHQSTNWNAADKQRRQNFKVTNTWCFLLSAVLRKMQKNKT